MDFSFRNQKKRMSKIYSFSKEFQSVNKSKISRILKGISNFNQNEQIVKGIIIEIEKKHFREKKRKKGIFEVKTRKPLESLEADLEKQKFDSVLRERKPREQQGKFGDFRADKSLAQRI